MTRALRPPEGGDERKKGSNQLVLKNGKLVLVDQKDTRVPSVLGGVPKRTLEVIEVVGEDKPRNTKPHVTDVTETKKGYDPVKVGLGVGVAGMATALAATMYIAGQKPNITINVPGAVPAPVVAPAPPAPPPASTAVITVPSTRPPTNIPNTTSSSVSISPELKALELGRYELPLASILQGEDTPRNMGYIPNFKVSSVVEFDLTANLPEGMTPTDLLNIYELLDKADLLMFLHTLDKAQKAEIIRWIDGYEQLASIVLPKNTADLIQAAREKRAKEDKTYQGYAGGPQSIANYTGGALTPLQVRAHFFQTEHASELTRIKKSIADLRDLLKTP